MSYNNPVPKNWQLVKLSALGEVNRGRSRHRPRDAAHLYGGPYPFIQTGDIKSSGGRITNYTQTYSEEGLDQSRLWPTNTMCITIAANIAETGILTFPACFPDSVIGFIPDVTCCNVYFIEYIFRLLRKSIQQQATGSVQDNINLQTLESLLFPVPKLEEQNRIAEALCCFDDKIELNRQINQTLEQIAQVIFKSWFVNFEPVKAKIAAKENGQDPERAAMCAISGKSDAELNHLPADQLSQLATTAARFPDELVESELGMIPEGWTVKPLDEIAYYQNGLALQKFRPENEDDFLPIVKIAQLKKGIADSNEKASPNINPACIIDNGDIIFSWSGSLTVDLWCGGKAALNQHLFKVTSDSFPKWFYYLWTKHHLASFQQFAADKAVTMGHIKRSHLKETLCTIVMVQRELEFFSI